MPGPGRVRHLLNTTYLAPMEGGQRVYGGVRVDLEVAADRYGQRPAWLALLLLADLPLSAAADTACLPYTLAAALLRARTVELGNPPPTRDPDRPLIRGVVPSLPLGGGVSSTSYAPGDRPSD